MWRRARSEICAAADAIREEFAAAKCTSVRIVDAAYQKCGTRLKRLRFEHAHAQGSIKPPLGLLHTMLREQIRGQGHAGSPLRSHARLLDARSGLTFGLSRSTLPGSYLSLMATRRA